MTTQKSYKVKVILYGKLQKYYPIIADNETTAKQLVQVICNFRHNNDVIVILSATEITEEEYNNLLHEW